MSHDGRRFAVAWKDVGIGEPNVYWAISSGPSFAEDSLVYDKIWETQDHSAIAIDTAGTVWTVWEDERSHPQQIWVRSSVAFDKGRAISDRTEGQASFPAIACNAGPRCSDL